ncbi:MAG TPA: type II and III secretion system protein [Rubricoccaceae bacterium]|jgi:type IV pilus assembly protein PilQ
MTPTPRLRLRPAALRALGALALGAALLAPAARAQDPDARPSSTPRIVRGYVPPDELVSFPASTPMNQFFRLVNPTFFRVTGKRVVDPMDREDPIGVALNGVHFIDAFELVLDRYSLDFNESDSYFIVTEPELVSASTDGVSATPIGAAAPVAAASAPELALPATADTREIRIDAVIFELNTSRAREVGTNWPALFGAATGGGTTGGTTGGSTGGTTGGTTSGATGPSFFINAGSFFDALDGFLEASGDRIQLTQVLNLFRYFEEQGFGQTVAAPFTTVQSGEEGQMQSGQDIPVNIRDFSGNTTTSYVQTGTIINVTPTLIVDERGGTPIELIHLNVKVEKSTALPGGAINKNNINTQIPLLSGEMRAIGGLTSTDESSTRRGVPILRDIPVLNFFFSYRQRQVVQKELVVVLMARVVDDIRTRSARERQTDIIRAERDDYRDRMDAFNPGAGTRTVPITPADPIRVPDGTQQPVGPDPAEQQPDPSDL